MRVYQVNVVCGYGSTGRIAADLAYTIKEYGGDSRIAYGRGDAPQDLDTIKISSKFDFYTHALMTRITDKHGLYSKGATKCLINDIRKYNPDIIHLHNIHGYYVNYEMLFRFLKKYNRPIVWTLHDCWTYTGHCAYFDFVGCDKWQNQCYKCPQKKKYPISVLRDNSKENFLRKKNAFVSVSNITFVTVSNWLKNTTYKSFFEKYRILKISNGINLNVMKPTDSDLIKEYNLENKKILLGVATVWDKRKGLDTFYNLAIKLPDNYKIVLIGLSKKQIAKKPKSILAIERIKDPSEMAKWYTVADIFVNTSVEETMGLTTVEAMACGTPVIVMNTTASPELVGEGCGTIVDAGNIDELVSAVVNLEKNIQISKCCMKNAKNYEKDKQYKKYIELYNELLLNVES